MDKLIAIYALVALLVIEVLCVSFFVISRNRKKRGRLREHLNNIRSLGPLITPHANSIGLRTSPENLLKMILDSTVVFSPAVKLELCKDNNVSRFGQCAIIGASSVVLHAFDVNRRSEKMVKVYHYSDSVTRQALHEVQAKLDQVSSPLLIKGTLIEEGLTLIDRKTNAELDKFDIAIMDGGFGEPPYKIKSLSYFLDPIDISLPRELNIAPAEARALRSHLTRSLRKLFSGLIPITLAHCDICPDNIGIRFRSDKPEEVDAYLFDTDSLSWVGHTYVAEQISGHKGFFTPGRFRYGREHVKACESIGRLTMIDAPAKIVCYLGIIGSLITPRIAFLGNSLDSPADLNDVTDKLRAHAALRNTACVQDLIDDLHAHCDSRIGIDLDRKEPFREESERDFETFEQYL